MVVRHDPVPEVVAETGGKPDSTVRCRACQLQLCKSRQEAPHANLTETLRDDGARSAHYECRACGTILLCSRDMGRPGWSIPR